MEACSVQLELILTLKLCLPSYAVNLQELPYANNSFLRNTHTNTNTVVTILMLCVRSLFRKWFLLKQQCVCISLCSMLLKQCNPLQPQTIVVMIVSCSSTSCVRIIAFALRKTSGRQQVVFYTCITEQVHFNV